MAAILTHFTSISLLFIYLFYLFFIGLFSANQLS